MDLKPNRLGIGHLLLWMATTSAVLAEGQWNLSTARLPESLLAEARFRTLIWSLGFGPLQGLALAGVLLFLWRRFWSHVPFPTEPGHSILIISGADRVATLAAHVSYLLAVRGNESSIPNWANHLPDLAINGFPILLAVIGACTVQSRIWSLSILAMGLVGAMTIFHNVALDWPLMRPLLLEGKLWGFLLRSGYTLPGLLALAAVFFDWRGKQRRDFLHWCGVALVVLGPMASWLQYFLR